MITKNTKIPALFLFFISLLTLSSFYLYTNKEEVFERILLPDNIKQPTNAEDFHDYSIEFMQLVLPEHNFHEVKMLDYIRDTEKEIERLLEMDQSGLELFYWKSTYGRAKELNFYFVLDGERHEMTISNNSNRMTELSIKRDPLTNERMATQKNTCGPNVKIAECFTFVASDGGICYDTVWNNYQFTIWLGKEMSYCPSAYRFDNKKMQFVNYIGDYFVRLEIPEVLNPEYNRPQLNE